MKRFFFALLALSYYSSVYAKDVPASQIYAKKCAMCHKTNGPETYEEKKAMVAPPITLSMKSVTIGVDAVEEPKTKEQLRTLVIAFLKDYMWEPHRDKSFCEDIIFTRFNLMPSMKGFVTPKELDKVLPYVYDEFAPKY